MLRFPVSTDLYKNDTTKAVSLDAAASVDFSRYSAQLSGMILFPLLFALLQQDAGLPAAVDASSSVAAAEPWDNDPVVVEPWDGIPLVNDAAASTASDAGWSADEAATALAACEALTSAAVDLVGVYEGEVQQEARLRLLRQIPSEVAGAERKDERALGHLEAALATETGFMAARVRDMDGALDRLAAALEQACS